MSREEKEKLVQKQGEEHVEANCECNFIQSVQEKRYKNQNKQGSFISTLLPFSFMNWKLDFSRNCLFLLKAMSFTALLTITVKIKETEKNI